MAQVLENIKNQLMEKDVAQEQDETNNIFEGFEPVSDAESEPPMNVILPIIRRVMPTIIANEIIGVQPMTGPTSQIHTLRVKYNEDDKDELSI